MVVDTEDTDVVVAFTPCDLDAMCLVLVQEIQFIAPDPDVESWTIV